MAQRLKRSFYRFGLLAAIAIGAILLLLFSRFSNIRLHDHTAELQQNFSRKEHQLYRFTTQAMKVFTVKGEEAMAERYTTASPFYLHVYRNDSLIFWNTNELPVYWLADLHFPSDGLIRLQNGWYYTQVIRQGNLQVVGSFYIRRLYPYENEQLQDHFNPELTRNTEGVILPEQIKGKSIHDLKGNHLFSFEETQSQNDLNRVDTILFSGILLLVLLLWIQLNRWFRQPYAPLLLAAVFSILRVLASHYEWFSGLENSSLFDPSILALSERTPNLGELLVSFLLLLIIANALIRTLKNSHQTGRLIRWITLIAVLILPVLGYWMSLTAQEMVENSSIPLQLDQVFSLTRYSLIVLFMIGIAGFAYIMIVYEVMGAFLRSGWQYPLLFQLWFVPGLIALFVALQIQHSINAVLWFLLLSGLVLFVHHRWGGRWDFSLVLLALFLFSIGATLNIHEFARIKEREERELYANQLADDKDLNTELEYLTAKQQLLEDPYMERFRVKANRPEASELKEALERRVFNGFWERYDMDFFYFDVGDSSTRFNGKKLEDFQALITRHGEVSEVDSSLFFVKDYTSQYAYVFLQELQTDSSTVLFFGTMKSKKIPEEIGFPRLLISDKAKVFESLGAYSIAKYYSGKLVARYGSYSFPFEAGVIPEIRIGRERMFFDKDGFNHFLLRRTDKDMIILSRQNTSWVDWVTTVAFLFVYYGFLLSTFLLFQSRAIVVRFRGLSLAVKIQVVLVGLVFVSLVAFGFGSGTFVQSQYEEYTNDLIREKIHSVGVVSKLRLGDQSSIEVARKAIDMEYYLRNWSHIFVTDINVYDLHGRLVSSSRPKIYNIGLLSEQMHPAARQAMVSAKKSEFIHQESIGSLMYLSAYTPFFNDEGKLIAYVNLQHFDQQNEFENQIRRFLVAIINVFMLLLALSIIGAVFISSWLTSPLRMIRRSFSRMELGKNNQPIEYHSKDEIGDLVREYNAKLAELEAAAIHLAKSGRESAWREMAKQVAHEIKNPLTPMKLSIQQLLRVYDPNDPDSKRKIERVAQSVIEQIDALTSIANAFSNFAKMPQPNMEQIELRAFLESIVAVFDVKDSCEVELLSDAGNVFIQADREMLLRVMNNLITNAIQAIPPQRTGRILISLSESDEKAHIYVSDNGTGIPHEQLNTVFEPYFTTKSTGTGLGLAMVRQIVEGHGGAIAISETSPEGTTIHLVFPID